MASRLSAEDKNEIEALVKNNHSLNNIAIILGKSKTTIYYHYVKIKGKTVEKLKIISGNEELIGEFIGLFAGDGCLDKTPDYKYRIYLFFNIKEKKVVEKILKNNLLKIFSKKPMIFYSKNKIIICFYSKAMNNLIKHYLTWDYNFRKSHTVQLSTLDHPVKFMIGFLRGSIDSDGHISKNKIVFSSVSTYLIKDIAYFLENIDIKYSIYTYREKRENRKDMHHVYIKKSDFQKFKKIVKPRKVGT